MEIIPSEIGRLNVGDDSFLLSPETDVIHRFRDLGANVLRVTIAGGKYQELHIQDDFVDRVVEMFSLPVAERTNITRDEYDRILNHRVMLTDEDAVMQHLLDSVMADKPVQGELF